MYNYGQNFYHGSVIPDVTYTYNRHLQGVIFEDDFQYYENYPDPNLLINGAYSQLNEDRPTLGGIHIPTIHIPGTSPSGKKGFENLLKKFGYDKPYSTKCKAKGPFGSWTWVPCVQTETVVTGVYFGFNYPANVTPEQEAGILTCGKFASEQGYAVIEAGFANGGPLGAIAAVPPANSTTREVLKKCLENAGLTTYIVKNTQAGIYTKRIS